MAKEFQIPDIPTPEVQVEPKRILASFGLQRFKSRVFGVGEDEPDKIAPVAFSYLGTPVFSELEIIEGSYKNLEGEQINYEGITIQTVLFTVSQNKNVVKTPIQGRNGTVKEYISDGDYDVTIRGLLVDPSASKYPEEQVLKLVEILKVQKEIGVASRFLNDVFGISDIVVESYSFPESEGFENVQAFEISAVSDDPIELRIRQE